MKEYMNEINEWMNEWIYCFKIFVLFIKYTLLSQNREIKNILMNKRNN